MSEIIVLWKMENGNLEQRKAVNELDFVVYFLLGYVRNSVSGSCNLFMLVLMLNCDPIHITPNLMNKSQTFELFVAIGAA